MTPTPAARLVLDWDGTVTDRDTLHLVIERFGDLDVFREMEAQIGRPLTLQEVIAVEMATVKAPLAEVVRWLVRTVRLRPGFRELAERHDPLVVSAGFHELIAPLLERESIELEVRANTLRDGGDGWQAAFRDTTPCPACGEPCKRNLVADVGTFVYVGDGVSDRCAAQAAVRVFARDGLAAYLEGLGVPYERFDDFRDLAERL